MQPKPRIAFVTHHHPWHGFGGGRLRERELLERLAESFAITAIAVCKVPADLARAERGPVPVSAFPVHANARDRLRTPGERRHCSPTAARELAALLDHRMFDLVHMEGHYLSPLLPHRLSVPLIIADNNVESDLLAQRAALACPRLHRAALRWDQQLTRRSEDRAWRRADAVVTLTDRDRDLVIGRVPMADVRVVPDGADHLPLPDAAGGGAGSRVLFAANWAYQPNADAARWLLAEVGPRIVAIEPRARVHVAGADAPEWLRRDVAALDWVELTSPYVAIEPLLDDARVVLCPLRIGGGVKVKVLEAVRRGRPVVTTTVGAQGIEGRARDALLVADDADALARHVAALLRDDAYREAVAWATLKAAGVLPTWDACAGELATCWEDALELGVGRGSQLHATAR